MPANIDNKKLLALISLLDDPDKEIFRQISGQIITYGIEAVPLLEEKWENTFESNLQKRIENIIHTIQFTQTCHDLENWVKLGSMNLLMGYIILSKYQYPDINEEEIRKNLDKIKQDVWLELSIQLTSLEKINIFNHVFYSVAGFSANTANIHSPQHFYLNTVLESKKGNSLSLGIIYSILAQNLGLPIYGVNLPDHFILAYTKQSEEEQISSESCKEILFYINPFNKGAIFAKEALDLYIEEHKLKPKIEYYLPCSAIVIMKRLVGNLIRSYEKIGTTSNLPELEILFKILDQ
jgi:regulator of sirC expression with transglutaminase-like and TPR domain